MNSSSSPKRLSDDDFRFIIANTKLVSIDLVFVSPDGAILMGERINKPVQGKWFVPGGRIYKEETIDSALHRITHEEIGIKETNLQNINGVFSGPYDHIYLKDSFNGASNDSRADNTDTEYIVLGYYANVSRDFISLQNLPEKQHCQWAWIKEDDSEFDIHENSRRYFDLSRYVLFSDVAYDILNRRRDSFNQLLWATPSVSLVAQSFLFSIILGSDVGSFSRLLAAGLSMIISLASSQLLTKHRFNEKELAIELESIEKSSNRRAINSRREPENWFVEQSSFRIWFLMIVLFGLAAFCVAVREILSL